MSIPKRFILFCSKNKKNAYRSLWRLYTKLAGNNYFRIQQSFSLPQGKMLTEILESSAKQSRTLLYKGKSDWTSS